jgi:hypothetical protein
VAASEDLSAELIKFNAFLAAEQDRERQAREQKKATRLREQAAAALKSVMADTGSSKEARADAEAVWKAAVAAEERVKAGGPLKDPAAEPDDTTDGGGGGEGDDTDAPTEESAATQPGADEPAARDETATTPIEAAAATGGDPELTEIPEAGSDAPADP